MIHINKGRLHAFRKLSTHKLPDEDCHAKLRANFVEMENPANEQLCISLAWDWMYRGVTEAGISREICATLACTRLNRLNKLKSLAIPEVSLLHMSRSICLEPNNGKKTKAQPYRPAPEVICRGILPSLRLVGCGETYRGKGMCHQQRDEATQHIQTNKRPTLHYGNNGCRQGSTVGPHQRIRQRRLFLQGMWDRTIKCILSL